MTSRRTAGDWGHISTPAVPRIDVLIPTAGRVAELAVTLAGLAAQDDPPFRVVLSDQSDPPRQGDAAVTAMIRVLEAQGREVTQHRHLPRRGMSEQRQFLLEQAEAPYVLFLDDDVWLEPGALARMCEAIEELECGFVGMATQGLSYLADDRPHERLAFEPWQGGVEPERVRRGTAAFERWPLHNAANPVHLARDMAPDERGWTPYKVAWIGGCVLFDRAALLAAGGYSFWRDMPPDHSGEDVAAQWSVMDRFGGAGIIPSSSVHLEAPTTIPYRPVDAFDIVFG